MDIRGLIDEAKPEDHKIEDSDAILTIVKPKPHELRKITAKATVKKRGKKGLGVKFEISIYNKLCMDKFIVGWKNIGVDGKDLECNLENKILCDDNWKEFSECWANVVSDVQYEDDDESEEEVKNL